MWGFSSWYWFRNLISHIEPATEKQKRLLEKLGVEYEGYMTKNKASKLISEELEKTKMSKHGQTSRKQK